MLTGTLSEEKAFEKGDWRSRRGNLGNINLFQHLFGPDYFLKNLRAVEELKGIAKRYNKSLPQLAAKLRWITLFESRCEHGAGRMPQSGRGR